MNNAGWHGGEAAGAQEEAIPLPGEDRLLTATIPPRAAFRV